MMSPSTPPSRDVALLQSDHFYIPTSRDDTRGFGWAYENPDYRSYVPGATGSTMC